MAGYSGSRRRTTKGITVTGRGAFHQEKVVHEAIGNAAEEVIDVVGGVIDGIIGTVKGFFTGNWQLIAIGVIAALAILKR